MSAESERAIGILLGLAAGDRNGGPIRMAVRLAESLAERGHVDVEDIGQRYLDWWRAGAFDTGPTAARVLSLVDDGLSFEDASQQVHIEMGQQTAGCNPAHRSSPLAMLPDLDTQALADDAQQEATLTHRHTLSGDVAAAVVVACSQLVRGIPWEDALATASLRRQPETRAAIEHWTTESLSSGGFAPDVLAAAIHFLSINDSFDEALTASLEFAGPANYCPVLVGSIGGARWGAGHIGPRLLAHCEILGRVRLAAGRLAAKWE